MLHSSVNCSGKKSCLGQLLVARPKGLNIECCVVVGSWLEDHRDREANRFVCVVYLFKRNNLFISVQKRRHGRGAVLYKFC